MLWANILAGDIHTISHYIHILQSENANKCQSRLVEAVKVIFTIVPGTRIYNSPILIHEETRTLQLSLWVTYSVRTAVHESTEYTFANHGKNDRYDTTEAHDIRNR